LIPYYGISRRLVASLDFIRFMMEDGPRAVLSHGKKKHWIFSLVMESDE
jgi:hypothetical protein